jgi:hypothetical protein
LRQAILKSPPTGPLARIAAKVTPNVTAMATRQAIATRATVVQFILCSIKPPFRVIDESSLNPAGIK